MQTRISPDTVYENCPRLAKHLIALGQVSLETKIPDAVIHLVKIRVSQINHCCFCQHMHASEARASGEQQARLDVLPAWQEAPCFSNTERAALSWAEALTTINTQRVNDAIFARALDAFGEHDLIELTTIVLEINSWNRLSVSLQFEPDMSLLNIKKVN